jgi:SAM-dependent methyltransferase
LLKDVKGQNGATPDARALAVRAWLEVADLVDLQLSPLGQRAIDALNPRPSEVIVDIGCGAGKTVLQLAERVGTGGDIIGVDIAHPLIERARLRAAGLQQVRFIECDATHVPLPEKSVDAIFSRFGVMAFADPIAAFANFHQLLKRSGRMAFVCWRALAENELDILPLRAAGLEHRADQTPFCFESPDFLRDVLKTAGFGQIAIEPCDLSVSSGGLEESLSVLLKVGPLGKIVREHLELRETVEPRVRAALEPKVIQGRVSLNAAIWIVTAIA